MPKSRVEAAALVQKPSPVFFGSCENKNTVDCEFKSNMKGFQSRLQGNSAELLAAWKFLGLPRLCVLPLQSMLCRSVGSRAE